MVRELLRGELDASRLSRLRDLLEYYRPLGLNVPASELVRVLGRDALLVERFDRTPVPGQRRLMVPALTVLGLTR